MAIDDFLSSPQGRLAQQRARTYRRVHLNVAGVEPGSKNGMRLIDKLEFQRQVRSQMAELRRRAFRDQVALQLSFSTTSKTPAHAHQIAKNLLDLLGRPMDIKTTGPAPLLYADDRQVHALSVECVHGTDEPDIRITARPFGSVAADLALVLQAGYSSRDAGYEGQDDQLDDALDDLRDLLRNRANWLERFGQATYEAMLAHSRLVAQEHLLGMGGLTIQDLAHSLVDRSRVNRSRTSSSRRQASRRRTASWADQHDELAALGARLQEEAARISQRLLRSHPLRIRLESLPTTAGSSARFRKKAQAAVMEFRDRFAWVLQPLLLPAALEVVVQPPAGATAHALHDLDNVVRRFVIPPITEAPTPPSDFVWAVDIDRVRASDPALADRWQVERDRLPKSARVGVRRFEVWRQPPLASDESGFVSVGLLAERGQGSLLHRLDDDIETWREAVRDHDDRWD